MKNFLLMTAVLAGAARVFGGTIQWPVGSAGTGSQTRTLFTAFGDFNRGTWESVSGSNINFHTGIDILPFFDGDDVIREVRAAKTGYFQEIIYYPQTGEFLAVIVDDYDVSTHGWGYAHLTNPLAQGWIAGPEEPPITQGSLIAEMHQREDRTWIDHLHFEWLPADGDPSGGSDVNPLDALMGATTLDWKWNRGEIPIPGNAEEKDTLLYIRDMAIESWPDHSSNLVTLDRNSLWGEIDVLYGYCLTAKGVIDASFPGGSPRWLNPLRMEWTLYRLIQAEEGFEPSDLFTRYVVDFSGIDGQPIGIRGAQHNTLYKQHYFRLSDYDRLGYTPGSQVGRIVCLTNVGDAAGYDGINNIQENSWQTNQHISGPGMGTAQASELALYRDGLYQIQVSSYAHNDVSHVFTDTVTVDNFPPNVVEAIVYRKGPENDVSSTLPPILGWWQWEIEEDRTLSRNLQDNTTGSNHYLSEDEEDRLGVLVVFSEQMEELPELWISGEWPGGSWDSRNEGSGAVFNACEWDPGLPSPSPDSSHLYQCFETSAGITGYHGTLRLNIAGGEDMSGNALDADPSTVAVPRDTQGFGAGYEQGVDSSYIWSNALPDFQREDYGSTLVTGSYGIEVELDEEMVRYAFISSEGFTGGLFSGNSPYWHGFWMGIADDSSLPNDFRVRILDFQGQVVKSMTISTQFPIRAICSVPGYSASGIAGAALSGAGSGDYCWVAVNSLRYRPSEDPPTLGTGSGRVFLYMADGSTVDNLICEGTWYPSSSGEVNAPSINRFEHMGSQDCIRVYYWVPGPDETGYEDDMVLCPPSRSDRSTLQIEQSPVLSGVTETGLGSHPFSLTLSRNPVSTDVAFLVSLPEPGMVELTIHDLTGREVQRVLDEEMPAGVHSLASQVNLPSGVYFCRLRSGGDIATGKVLIVR